MKKTYINLFNAALALLFVCSCDTIEDRASIGGEITVDQLKISAEPIVINGKNSNKVVLKCQSPVSPYWDFGVGESLRSNDTIMMLFTGENEIEFTGLNPNGTKISKTLTVNIEELSDPVPPQWEMLFGNGEKDWTWSSSFCHLWGGQACFGNGGYLTDQLICWWTMGADSQDLTDAAGVDSQGAKMTFCKNGVKFIKTSNDGSTVEGRYSIDMNKKTYDEDGNVWAIGRLYIKANPSATILRGYGDDGKPQQEFDIIQMEDGLMQLSEVPAAGSGAWAGVLGWAFSPIQK